MLLAIGRTRRRTIFAVPFHYEAAPAIRCVTPGHLVTDLRYRAGAWKNTALRAQQDVCPGTRIHACTEARVRTACLGCICRHPQQLVAVDGTIFHLGAT